MLKELFSGLNNFNDNTVMVCIDEDKIINSTRVLERFTYRVETYKNNKQSLMVQSFPDEQYFTIPLEAIKTWQGYFDEETELIISLSNNMLIQLYIEE